jgi:hypothetical protein
LVVDEAGRPVEGVELFQTGVPSGPKPLDQSCWTGRSGAQGRFVADASKAWAAGATFIPASEGILAYQPGFRLAGVTIGQRSRISVDDPLRILLKPVAANASPLRVIGPDGTPVAAAKIRVRHLGGRTFLTEEVRDRFAVTTALDGRANLAAFSPEDVRLVDIETKSFGTQIVKIDPAATGEQTLTLSAVGRLSGRIVVDPQEKAGGLTVRGATFEVPNTLAPRGSFMATTDSEGRFAVPALVPGPLVLYPPTSPPHLFEDQTRRKPVQIVAGKLAEVEIVMKRGVQVQGALRERGTQRPIVGATVTLRTAGSPPGVLVRTDRLGEFEGYVSRGQISISLADAGPYVLAKGSAIKLEETPEFIGGEIVGVIEVVQGVSLRGVVRDEQGRPAPAAAIACWSGESTLNHGPSQTLKSNDRGEFVAEGLSLGVPFELTARLGEAATALPTVVTPGETKDLTLTVSPASTVSLGGRVVDEYGKPIAGASVVVRSRWKTSMGAKVTEPSYAILGTTKIITDSEGRFQVPRKLLRHAQHQAEASFPGKYGRTSEYFAATTPSFFDLALDPVAPPNQVEIRADFDAGSEAENRGEYAEAEAKYESALSSTFAVLE